MAKITNKSLQDSKVQDISIQWIKENKILTLSIKIKPTNRRLLHTISQYIKQWQKELKTS
jgi:hypothetical protein